jgi:hypothetical protein
MSPGSSRRNAAVLLAAVASLCVLAWLWSGPLYVASPDGGPLPDGPPAAPAAVLAPRARGGAYHLPHPLNAGAAACGYALTRGQWTAAAVPAACPAAGAPARYASCGGEPARRWEYGPAARACAPRHYTRAAAGALLSSRWVAFVGDSISRSVCVALMAALGAPAQAFTYDRHADFERALDPGVRVSFHWAPFPENATALVDRMRSGADGSAGPDVVLLATALWPMLHVRDAGAYGARLRELARASRAALAERWPANRQPVLLAAAATEVFPELLAAPAKREAMTPAAVDAYNRALAGSGLLAGEGPYGLLDMFALTHGGCGGRAWRLGGLPAARALPTSALTRGRRLLPCRVRAGVQLRRRALQDPGVRSRGAGDAQRGAAVPGAARRGVLGGAVTALAPPGLFGRRTHSIHLCARVQL